jgi:uncharacterized protein
MNDDVPDVQAEHANPDAPNTATTTTNRAMLEALICPVTHGPLTFDADQSELISRLAGLAYPIRAGIPIMLQSEARVLG